MKVLAINAVNYGSTGGIALQIINKVKELGGEGYVFCPKPRKKNCKEGYHYYGNSIARKLSTTTSKFAFMGQTMVLSTRSLLRKIDKIKPDVIHLHNLHNETVNLPMLFGYIKKRNVRVIWTLHDCWAFTGKCAHFTMVNCQKWETGCHHCPQYKQYPVAYTDRTKGRWKAKKKWFTGVKDMTIVTPSQWLADLVKRSYLKEYPVEVIHNGIDLSIFKPTESDFRKKHGLEDKYILLGVAFGWGKRKGLDVFLDLEKKLDSRYQIVLVGTDEEIDAQLPKNILSIHCTQNQTELVEIYTAADVFVNPTREENYPTVNMEAIACGTPVVTFATGGSPESLDETCGSVVACNDNEGMLKEIIRVCEEKPYSVQACLNRAKTFDKNARFMEYVELYNR